MKSYCKGLVLGAPAVAAAYCAWAEAPSGKKNAWRVAEEHGSAMGLINEIASEIASRSLSFRPIKRYVARETVNRKRRTIGVESVKQQVCDYLAVRALEPMLKAKVGHWQVSSQEGKGQLFCARAVGKWLREGGYWVHMDVRKCYPSISHDVVTGALEKHVRSADVIYLCGELLRTYTHGGLDIGSYFSLRMAQFVLSRCYHHIEGLHKTRRGRRVPLVRHQVWYMDDLWLFGPRNADLKAAARSVAAFASAELGLTFKPWKVCRVGDQEPVKCVGFEVRPDRTTLQAPLFLRAMRAFRDFERRPTLEGARRVCSYWGWVAHTDSRGLAAKRDLAALQARARRLISEHDREGRRGAHG